MRVPGKDLYLDAFLTTNSFGIPRNLSHPIRRRKQNT